jgi:acetyl-CoA acyltransferase 1
MWGPQVSDGAGAVLLMTRREALKRGLPILGIFRSFAAVGVDPAVMGIGPAVAIPAAVQKAGLSIDDIDLFELNEAFASQVCLHDYAPYVLHSSLRVSTKGCSTCIL